jgi:hypothetical protein
MTKSITIKQLRAALRNVHTRHDNKEVEVWLPGSRIYLAQPGDSPPAFFEHEGKMLIEGNLRPGSALE